MKDETTYWSFMFRIVIPTVILVLGCGWLYTFVIKPLEVANDVTNSKKIVFDYEWFTETYHDAKILEQQIAVAQDNINNFQPSGNSFRDNSEERRLYTVLAGLQFQLIDVIEQYNAYSKMSTRNVFKDNRLPYQLELEGNTVREIY